MGCNRIFSDACGSHSVGENSFDINSHRRLYTYILPANAETMSDAYHLENLVIQQLMFLPKLEYQTSLSINIYTKYYIGLSRSYLNGVLTN